MVDIKKLNSIRKICDDFDSDFDDPLESLKKIAKIVGSKNKIDDDDNED